MSAGAARSRERFDLHGTDPWGTLSLVSEARFSDGLRYRIEIPSVEGPLALRAVLEEAEAAEGEEGEEGEGAAEGEGGETSAEAPAEGSESDAE